MSDALSPGGVDLGLVPTDALVAALHARFDHTAFIGYGERTTALNQPAHIANIRKAWTGNRVIVLGLIALLDGMVVRESLSPEVMQRSDDPV